jgi:hypothetical protein
MVSLSNHGLRGLCVNRRGTGVIIRAMKTLAFILGLAALRLSSGQALRLSSGQALRLSSGQATPTPKVEIVSVTGCLKETAPNTWTLTTATDPVPSNANAPPAKDIPSTPPAGKHEFRLIGVSEFNLPAHRDHTVVVKGLFIKATPVSRLNVTSVTMATATCAPAPAK